MNLWKIVFQDLFHLFFTTDSMIKRIFDIIVSLIGLLLISPILLIVSLLIKLYMPGPVFFRQQRTGRYGKSFTIVKFRSMVVNDDSNTTSVLGDNRITPLGAMLRKYKLDELPELWNVLKGDMSLVGPRPDVPEFTSRLKGDEMLILKLRPGITGPATLKYSDEERLLAEVDDPQKYTNEIIWPEKVRINLDYYYHWSLMKDIKIIFSTLFRQVNY